MALHEMAQEAKLRLFRKHNQLILLVNNRNFGGWHSLCINDFRQMWLRVSQIWISRRSCAVSRASTPYFGGWLDVQIAGRTSGHGVKARSGNILVEKS